MLCASAPCVTGAPRRQVVGIIPHHCTIPPRLGRGGTDSGGLVATYEQALSTGSTPTFTHSDLTTNHRLAQVHVQRASGSGAFEVALEIWIPRGDIETEARAHGGWTLKGTWQPRRARLMRLRL